MSAENPKAESICVQLENYIDQICKAGKLPKCNLVSKLIWIEIEDAFKGDNELFEDKEQIKDVANYIRSNIEDFMASVQSQGCSFNAKTFGQQLKEELNETN